MFVFLLAGLQGFILIPCRIIPHCKRQSKRSSLSPAERKGYWVFLKRIIGSSKWLGVLWSKKDKIKNIPFFVLWGKEDIAF
jgi:hypothetical protein